MPRVVHFETPAEDPERAAKFYADVFGWQTHKWDGPEEYWLIRTGEQGPGIDGAFMKPCAEEGGFAPRTPVNTIEVPSVDEALAKVEASGGRVVMPPMDVPGVGRLAYFADTEGVVSGMMQFAAKAPAAA